MIADVVSPRSRADLEAFLATADAPLTNAIQAALAAGEGSEEWAAAEFMLGTNLPPGAS